MPRLLGPPLLALLVSCGGEGHDLDERIPSSPGGVIEVDVEMGEGLRLDRGSLEVMAHDADEVWVVGDASGWGSAGVRFRLEHDEGRVRLYGRIAGGLSWLFGGPRVRVQVWVPRRFSADLRCSAGPIAVEDLRGSVRARTRGGDIEITGVEGEVRVRTDDGTVHVEEVTGPVDVKAAQGRIEVDWVTGDVEARTSSGDLSIKHVSGRVVARTEDGEIELAEVEGTVDAKTEAGGVYASFAGTPSGLLETRRGSVQVMLPEGTGSDLDARSARGTVALSDRLALRGSRDPDRVVGRINGGGPPLRIYTARGAIRVSER